jgi:hypothetical protein
MKHSYQQVLTTPSGSIADSASSATGDSIFEVDTTVAVNGGSANVVSVAIPSAGLVSLALISTVPCIVTFTGSTDDNQTLAANLMNRITAIGSDVTSLSVSANTVSSGPAGTIKIRVLWNS